MSASRGLKQWRKNSKMPRHFLDIHDLTTSELREVLVCASRLKACGGVWIALVGKILGMIFEKPSTRTRVSFDVGMRKLGGETVVLSEHELQRHESMADTARVLSRYLDGIVLRSGKVERLLELAQYATVPVINGLTDVSHPCQVLADVMCYEEHRGPIEGSKIAWCGDGTNVAESWVHAATRLGFELALACPEGFEVRSETLAWAVEQGGRVQVIRDPKQAVAEAMGVVTDSWISMASLHSGRDLSVLEPYRVDEALMSLAKPEAVFMHCLPAYRGQEVTAQVLEGDQSVVWDEAENRVYVQQAILLWCFAEGPFGGTA